MSQWRLPLILCLAIALPGTRAGAYSLVPDRSDAPPLLIAAARPLAPQGQAQEPQPDSSSDTTPDTAPPTAQGTDATSGTGPDAAAVSTRRAAAAPSLFRGRAGQGLFAPVPQRARLTPGRPTPPPTDGPTAELLHLIASVEADPAKGYDSVQFQARIKPPKPPSQMTLDEIHAWIRATPGQQHAIGRYQIVPQTLRGLQKILDLPGDAVFDAALQDRMADTLLRQAGYHRFLAGNLSRTGFMNNLARVWAALPNSTGRSHYHGLAGNRAAFSWAHFTSQMQAIFPR